MKKISAVITTFNEERKIEDCLKSVRQLADEIILVDGSSTDDTVKIAKKYTSKIYIRENNPMLNVNKNYGFMKATNEWILSLDADERVTLELAKEIKEILKSPVLSLKSDLNGYYVPRRNFIFGRWIKHAGWYPDYQLRLFKRGKGRFEEKHVHEMLNVEGKTGHLKSDILHLNYENVSQFLKKLLLYTQNEAEQLLGSGYIFDWRDCLRMPFKEFLSRFFARKGYKDGLHGLVLSLLMAFYHLIVFTVIWEKTKFREYDSENFLKETTEEIGKAKKEFSYWLKKENSNNARNPIERSLQKITDKLS